jgi:type IV pilus assembly protein PilW
MTNKRRAHQRGFTIVELMIAITLGLIILAGLITVLVNNIQARNEIERANQQIENGRYAMQLLSDDLRNAGYLAEFNPGVLSTPSAKPDPCATTTAALITALPLAVQGYDNGANAPTCVSDLRAGTDILVIRRVSTCAVGDTDCDAVINGAPYFQASACTSASELGSANSANYFALDTTIANLTLHQKDCNPPTTAGTLAPYHQYRMHIYFIANNDKNGDGIPTLKRAELGASGFSIVPLVEGIENLQIEYGLDTTSTGVPAVFTANPDSYSACAAAVCAGYWRNTVAAKVYVLARNLTSSSAYSDNKVYTLGMRADGVTANTFGPFNDAYKRHAYSAEVRLNNPAGRNTP